MTRHAGDLCPDEAGWHAQCEACFLRYADVVAHAARGVLGQRAAREDVVQEVFLRLLANRPPGRLSKGYFMVAGRNAALNHLREQGRADERIRRFSSAPQPSPMSPLDKIVKDECDLRVAAAIESLPPRCRGVARRTWLSGWDASLIAKNLGMTVKRVERHRAAARKRLREILL